MTPEEFNKMFDSPYVEEGYQGWKHALAKVATHPATAVGIFIAVAVLVAIFI